MLSHIDKTNWKYVTLEDLVIRREENDKEHARERFDRFVKVEHMDAESLHLKRWGVQGKEELPPTFYKIFRKGQILFPTRNPHLRRTSLASFDGICGEKTLTLEANEDVVDPNLLPFLFNSESFVAHTTSSIIGSTNPHVRWRDVARYEFLLPPKDEQACLAELLWAADDSNEALARMINSLEQTLSSYAKKIITGSIVKSTGKKIKVKSPFQTTWIESNYPLTWQVFKLSDLIEDYQNGFAEGERDELGLPQLRMHNVTRSGRLDLTSIEKVPANRNVDRYMIKVNDVLFCNTNSEDLVGKSILANDGVQSFTFSNHFTRLRPKELLTPRFLHTWLQHHFAIGLFERRCTRWIGQAAIQVENLLSLHMVLPPVEEQIIANKIVEQLDRAIDSARSKHVHSMQLQKSLINQSF